MERHTKPDPYAVEGGGTPEAGAAPAAASKGGPDSFTVVQRGGAHVIRFARSDVLDAHEIQQLGDDLHAYLTAIDGPRTVIDLEPVMHLSSAALGMLVTVKTLVESRGGGVCLANVRPEIRQIFTMTRLDKILRIYRTTDEAVEEV